MFRLASAFMCVLGTLTPQNAALFAEDTTEQNASAMPKIVNLLPGLLNLPGIDPALPQDFVMKTLETPADVHNRVLWGNRKVVNKYMKHNTLTGPIIAAKLTTNVTQVGPMRFDGEENVVKELKSMGFKNVKLRHISWGEYPVLVLEAQHPALGKQHHAWLGLNTPDKEVIHFSFLYPSKSPAAKDLAVWDDFINNTTPLSDKDFFLARGQDLQDGYTLSKAGKAQIKVLAERRKRDNKLLVAVIPDNEDIRFTLKNVEQGAMGGEWRHGDALVQLEGELIEKVEDGEKTSAMSLPVFEKDVEEYSVDTEELARHPNVVISYAEE